MWTSSAVVLALASSVLAVPAIDKLHPRTNDPVTVTVKNGTLQGVHSDHYNQDFFLSIPYAQPPVNELRYRVPQSINSTFNGTLVANEYAPECVGYGGDDIGYAESEDCLYLNVIRPSGYEGQDLPVGVWIHGGGLFMGGTADKRYNLSFIVENSVQIGKPIIAVSIGYRLTGWGFLNSQEVSGSGNTNLGLRDQRLALHWLQENIAAFGGDTSKVTIWGESAGAASVGYQLLAYNGRDDGLFRGGIMESGNPVSYQSFRDDTFYQPNYDAVVNATGCANEIDTLDCLRHVPFDQLNAVLNNSYVADSWQPVIDGDFLAKFGSIQLKEGNFVKVPIIDGANSDEGTSFGPIGVNTTQDFINDITSVNSQDYLPEFLASTILEAYPDNNTEYMIPLVSEIGTGQFGPPFGAEYRRSAAYWGDVVMIANRRGAVSTWAANGIPAYSYRFNTIPAGLPPTAGVTHFQEVAFVFNNIDGLGYALNPFENKSEAFIDLSNLMSKSWASFIYDQNPNNWTGRPSGTDDWPQYDVNNPQNIVWDANATTLAYAEPDTFRAKGIQTILDLALAYHR